jgi:hypothetical protein
MSEDKGIKQEDKVNPSFGLELIDPQSTLMQRFREIAPGTFKHCQNVATICESIAIDLKLDVMVLKTAAMLHDIGKMNHPSYYMENQTGKNPHDGIKDPFFSYHIITGHVAQSVMKLIQLKDVPIKVIEIISQHHGDTVLLPFYNKANEISKGSAIEDHYRYKSVKPQTTEAAILMIADCVDASARSLFIAGKLKKISNVVNNTIERLSEDEQLDEMKIGIIRIVKNVLCKEIEAMYHGRSIEGYQDSETLNDDDGDKKE